MGQTKKVMICLSENLLSELDDVVRKQDANRSQVIREAVRQYLQQKNRDQLREQLRQGYLDMARINLDLAEESFDDEDLDDYEERLVEAK